MKSKFAQLKTSLASPTVVVLAICLVLLVFNLFLTAKIRPFNSDDVSWQNILLTWHPYSGHVAYLGGSDNFILKVPLFALLGHFFGPTRKLLFLESSIFAVATFILFYLSALYFLRKLAVVRSYRNLLPFVWLASSGYYIAKLYLNPILRNFEIGLGFIFFVLAAKVYYEEFQPFKSVFTTFLTGLACLLSGLLVYNDPYFLYFTLVPIVLLFGVLYLIKQAQGKKLAFVLGFSAVSFVLSKLVGILVVKTGVNLLFTEPVQFVSFDKLFSNIALAIHGTLVIFGADFFGSNIGNLTSLSALANFAILLFILFVLWRLCRATANGKLVKPGPRALWSVFFGACGVFVVIVYTFSNLAVNLETYRYLILMLFSFVLLLAIAGSRVQKGRRTLAAVLVLATVLNLGVSITSTKHALAEDTHPATANNRANSDNFELIDTVRSQGLTKGYAPYWDGNINSYLSGGTIKFLPIICINGRTRPLYFLVDTGQFGFSAKRSFYVIDPSVDSPPTCTMAQLTKQFGKPVKTLAVNNKLVLIYDYDIYSKMQ